METTHNTTAIIVRISEDREGTELGVKRHLAECRALCDVRGWHVPDHLVFVDNDSSAYRGNKGKAYARLMELVRAGKLERIVTTETSRLWRNRRARAEGIETLVQHGVSVIPTKGPAIDLSTATGRMLAGILGEFDTFEVEQKSERTKRGAAQRAAAGKNHGGRRLYGVAVDGVTLVEDEAERVRGWCATIVAGGSLLSIANALTAEGAPTVNGGAWHQSTIRGLLRNPRIAGVRVLHGVEYPASNPAIVGRDVWLAVQAQLDKPERHERVTTRAKKWLGSGLYVCERCGVRVRVGYARKNGRSWRVYTCNQVPGGCSRKWAADHLDDWIVEFVAGIVEKEDAAERLLPKRDNVDRAALGAERLAIRTNLDAMAEDAALLRIDRAQLLRATEAANRRLDEIEATLTEAGREGPLASILASDDPAQAWRDLKDVSRRQAIIRSLMTVVLGTPVRGNRWNASFIETTPIGQG